jgi:hypothetical protein
MHLESVDGYAKPAADILGCDFKRAASVGSSWTGTCVERNQKDRSTSGSRATLTTFSDTEIEGSTEYIPEFVMIPDGDASFQRGQLVPGESASRGGVHIVTDVIGATAVLHGAFGRVLGECQTPCGFHDLVPTPYTVEVQRNGYRSVQVALRVMAGKVWQQKIELDKVLAEVPPTNAEPPHREESSPTPTPTPHKTAPVSGAEAAEYAAEIEGVIAQKGLTGRAEVQSTGCGSGSLCSLTLYPCFAT